MKTLLLVLALLSSPAFAGFSLGTGGSGGGSSAWGDLTGSLSSQADLQAALDAKLDSSSFSAAGVTGKLITGYSSGAGTVASSDTILQAINKLNGNAAAKAPTDSPTFTTQVTLPSGIVDSSSGFSLGTFLGGTNKIMIGTVRLSTENGSASRVELGIPNGGRFSATENGAQLFTMLNDSFNWCAFEQGRDCTMQWGMGKGVNHYGKGRQRGYTAVGPAGNAADASEDDLLSDTFEANARVSAGDEITVETRGVTGATGNTKTIKQYAGATAIHTISTVANAKQWSIRCTLWDMDSSTLGYDCKSDVDGTGSHSGSTLSANRSSSLAFKSTGQSSGSAANDAVANIQQIDFDKVGN